MPNRPPSLPAWARKFRPPVERAALGIDERHHNRQSIAIGVVATLIVHALFWFLPSSLLKANTSVLPHAADDVELELEEPPVVMAEIAEPPRYVETNPTAPENEPDKTANESDRNQQAANEQTPEELSPDHTPARDGEDIDSDKIVSGTLDPAEPSAPPMPEGDPAPEVVPSTPTEQDPLPGTEEDVGESPDGVGSSVAPPTEKPEPVSERVAGETTENKDTLPLVRATPPGGPRSQPAPRPRVVRTRPGPVEKQIAGVSQTGYIGVDSRFSQFGEYMARMSEAVQQRWDALCSSRAYGESATYVVIRFTLTRDGLVRDLETVSSSAQPVGVLLCRTALEQGQSYGLWTQEMVLLLGDDDEVTFTFHYR